MDSAQKPKVFRLRQLPGNTNEYQALVYLRIGLGNMPVENIQIFSLAKNLSPWRPSKIATLMFNPLPDLLQQGQGKDEWQIRVNGLEQPLILDIHFRGLTPLRDILPQTTVMIASPSRGFRAILSVHGNLRRAIRHLCELKMNCLLIFHSSGRLSTVMRRYFPEADRFKRLLTWPLG
ncbi:hypothetical protein F4811DRAFT_481281 [Daldinia bambusicola]|nr:hypothetical protein F4811DRAFT_481281 [Daldinia bambusicola]